MISQSELADLIEPHFLEDLVAESCTIEEFSPEELLTSNRLDVAIKILFLEGQKFGCLQPAELYREHIRLFTLGSFQEPGNEEKSTIEKYFQEFEKLEGDMRKSGFRSDVSLIPLGENGTILNGAHRLAAAIFHKQPVRCVRIPYPEPVYDYRFFLGRGMAVESVEAAVTRFIGLRKNCFVACVWPRAQGLDDQLDKLFPNIVYKRKIRLSVFGAHNLLSEVYSGEPWLGSAEEGFPGVKGKLIECFTNSTPMRLYVFQAESLSRVQEIKDKIRELFNTGKHSIHITDSHEEAVRLGQVLLNSNSRHFLEHGRPWAFTKTLDQICSLREDLQEALVCSDDVLVEGSMVMAIYGLREARDIDVLISEQARDDLTGYESHDSELKYHRVSKADLIYDTRFFFYHRGLKFLALRQLADMKRSRSEPKDHKDLQLVTPLLVSSRISVIKASIRGQLAFMCARFLRLIIDFLKKTDLYEPVRRIYRDFKGNKND